MVMIETNELDCMMVVVTTPNEIAFQNRSVVRLRIFSSSPPVNALDPSSRNSMLKRKIATPAAISLNSGLSQNP